MVNYSFTCTHGASNHVYHNESGHYTACPSGCYSIFESHNSTYTQTQSLTFHTANCSDCNRSYLESHNWIVASGTYFCTKCLLTTTVIPDIMSLPDPELELYLASLSDEELEEFIASLPEDQAARVTALLPLREDDLVTE